MKLLFVAFPLLLLSGCGTAVFNPDEEALLRNPLYAERHAEALVDAMVNLEIYEDPVLDDEEKKKIADTTKEKWLAIARTARADQRKGMIGKFIPVMEFAEGEVLFVENIAHISPEFTSTPGPEMHMLLTKVVDPREGEFPDPSVIDLGMLKAAYGAQSYTVPAVENWKEYRSVVLYDMALGRLHSFAQMNPLY